MIHDHNEIEAKLDATGVDIDAFRRWASDKLPERYLCVTGPDQYYGQNGHVVRHRLQPDGAHELTVKKRKSEKSTRDRLEIDLFFGIKTQPRDVQAFLEATGWKPVFLLVKKAHIFWFREGATHLTVVIYDVWRDRGTNAHGVTASEGPKRYIEIEAEKGSTVTPEHAKRRVNAWVKEIQEQFKLKDAPLNDSLYEIFSGCKYFSL